MRRQVRFHPAAVEDAVGAANWNAQRSEPPPGFWTSWIAWSISSPLRRISFQLSTQV